MKVYICSKEEAHRRADCEAEHLLVDTVPERFYGTVREGTLCTEDGAARVYVCGYIVPFFAVNAVLGG